MKKKHVDAEYSQITSYIWIGTNQCCNFHFKKELLRQGIDADISLEEERVDEPVGVHHFLWLPVKDHHALSQTQLHIGAAFMETLVKSKIKMYVHCKNGHGRSPSLVMAYFITQGKTYQQAFDLVKSKRPEVHLRPSQTAALRKFAQRRKK
ncbi:dual specificity protein phosphatase family protein [Candidatus Falkowbacteria bacterium]|nr:dual specificity protein phosphatase family protein [Candidatus Falkowbacteria bacterium]